MKFINRINELNILEQSKPGLHVIFGRRRIGKTTLIEYWSKDKNNTHYSQALEGSASIQLNQLYSDFPDIVPAEVQPKTWQEFLSLLSLINQPTNLIIDEFPYLVKSSPELPSLLQSWIDHKMPKNFKLFLLGSSQSMMCEVFLNSNSPLYERAKLILNLEPLNYPNFCEALALDPLELKNFENFSITGGVPKYWELIDPKLIVTKNAQDLFFQKSARLEAEPDRLLKDENISGKQAKSIFECIGRGASRPSEIASRMQLNQNSISNPLQLLMQSKLINRDTPFPESAAKSKKSLYKISDFTLRFWYKVYSPHRSRWHLYSKEKQALFIHAHASTVLEDCFRELYPDSQRYWQGKDLEIDSVRFDPNDLKSIIITEIKHSKLTNQERNRLEKKLKDQFIKSKLANKYKLSAIEVLDTEQVLERLSK